jgi:hypothetical protein
VIAVQVVRPLEQMGSVDLRYELAKGGLSLARATDDNGSWGIAIDEC